MSDKDNFFSLENKGGKIEKTRVRFPFQHSEDDAYYLTFDDKPNQRLYVFFRNDGKLLDKKFELTDKAV